MRKLNIIAYGFIFRRKPKKTKKAESQTGVQPIFMESKNICRKQYSSLS